MIPLLKIYVHSGAPHGSSHADNGSLPDHPTINDVRLRKRLVTLEHTTVFTENLDEHIAIDVDHELSELQFQLRYELDHGMDC